MRIAMWSGPRNLSTAMMYSFGNRPDFVAVDEPYYAAYLAATGLDHPMGDEIMQRYETNPDWIDLYCRYDYGPQHIYMKHMAHHMLDGFSLDWAKNCVNVHLIRHPARVIASYAAKRDSPTLDDIGFAQQLRIYEELGGLVIDSTDIRADPEGMLRKLCDAIDLPFHNSMLQWDAGPRDYDGLWAAHWYGAVHKSTGFAGSEGELPKLDPHQTELMEAALPYYELMAALKI